MSRTGRWIPLIAALAMAGWVSGCGGDDGPPDEPNLQEFQVNTTPWGADNWFSVDVGPDGQFLVAWGSMGGQGGPVRAQRIDANGHKLDAEMVVSQDTTSNNMYPEVRFGPSGEALIAYCEGKLSGSNVFSRRYGTDGRPGGNPVTVANIGSSLTYLYLLDLGFSSSGESVVVWGSDTPAIFGQRLAADGSRAGSSFLIHREGSGVPFVMDVAPDGTFLVAWYSDGTFKAQGQRFAADGSKIGTEMTFLDRGIYWPGAVQVLANGEFILFYGCDGPVFGGTHAVGSFMQRFAANGTKLGPEQLLSPAVILPLGQVSIAPDGKFAVTWSQERNGAFAVEARRFAADGSPSGPVLPVTSAGSLVPRVALAASGRMLVVWDRGGSTWARLFVE